MHSGDTLVVPAFEQLSRSVLDLIAIVSDLRRREVGFASLHENLDTTAPGGWHPVQVDRRRGSDAR